MSKNRTMYVKSRHHQRGHYQRGLHAKVCGKQLETQLTPSSKLIEFCILPKSHEGNIHMERLGKTWSEDKKTVIEVKSDSKVYKCPQDGTPMNPFSKAFFCPKCSTIRRKEEAIEA